MLCSGSKSSRAVGSLVEYDVVDERSGLGEVYNDPNLQSYPGLQVTVPPETGECPQLSCSGDGGEGALQVSEVRVEVYLDLPAGDCLGNCQQDPALPHACPVGVDDVLVIAVSSGGGRLGSRISGGTVATRTLNHLIEDDIIDERFSSGVVNDNSDLQSDAGLEIPVPVVALESPDVSSSRHLGQGALQAVQIVCEVIIVGPVICLKNMTSPTPSLYFKKWTDKYISL